MAAGKATQIGSSHKGAIICVPSEYCVYGVQVSALVMFLFVICNDVVVQVFRRHLMRVPPPCVLLTKD